MLAASENHLSTLRIMWIEREGEWISTRVSGGSAEERARKRTPYIGPAA